MVQQRVWSRSELEELTTRATTLMREDSALALGLLRSVLQIPRAEPERDPAAIALLGHLLWMWAVLEHRASNLEVAIALLDRALGYPLPNRLRHEMLVHRGLAWLRIGWRVRWEDADAPPPELVQTAWDRAFHDLRAATQLHPTDYVAWMHRGSIALYLGALGSHLGVRRRLRLLEDALASLQIVLRWQPGRAHRPRVVKLLQWAQQARTQLRSIPWWQRLVPPTLSKLGGRLRAIPANQAQVGLA